MQGCKKRELMPFYCEYCDKKYCMAHRQQFTHNCPGLKKSISDIRKIHAEKLMEAKKLKSKVPEI